MIKQHQNRKKASSKRQTNFNMLQNILITLITLLSGHLTIQQDCPSVLFNRSLELSFISHRNQSCHYVTQWSVKTQSPKLPDNMKIDVKSSTSEFGGLQTFYIHGILAVPPRKPVGYEYFPGVGYYKFYPDGVNTFNEALNICQNDGAHLAIINSAAESEVLKLMYARFPKTKEWAYLGFHDLEEEGKFFTIYGEPLSATGFTKWSTDNPDNYNNEDCGSMSKSGLLNDLPCGRDGPWPFFCEFDLHWGQI